MAILYFLCDIYSHSITWEQASVNKRSNLNSLFLGEWCLTNRASCLIRSTPMHLLKCQWDPHSHTNDIINPPKQREKMRQTSPLHFNLSALNKIFCSWKWESWGKIMWEVMKFNMGRKHIAFFFLICHKSFWNFTIDNLE